jgi:tetratricopeptide (TPR) repeat protein
MNKDFAHALVLLEQQRFDLAEEKLRQYLASDPDNGLSHALLAHCLSERQQLDEATTEAQQAIHLDPELAEGHAALARAFYLRNRHDEAEKAIQEALRLEPASAEYHALRASIALARRDWLEALDVAEQGLKIDAEHVTCNNLRAMALVKLGRKAEAGATMATVLARQPENAFSHANQGWTCLHEGKRQQALEHFREALRLDPTMDFARAGIVEAMKSKHWIYAVLLRYFLWTAGLSRTMQWGLVLGGYLGYQVLGSLAAEHPALAPWLQPVMIAYVVFALLTWLAGPLFNLLLRLDRFGRHALSRDQIVASNCVGILVVLAILCGVVWLITDAAVALLSAIYFGLLLLPVSAVFICHNGWPRRMMIVYTAALAVVGVAWFPLGMLGLVHLIPVCLQAFLWGSVLSGFVANSLAMQSPRL